MAREWWDPLRQEVKDCFLNALNQQRKAEEQANRWYEARWELKTQVARLENKVKQLEQQLVLKRKELEAAKRAEKRQAAPFSKGPPKERPRKPGQRRGHAPAHRPRPTLIDQVVDVPLSSCPHCDHLVEADRVEEQIIEDLEIRRIVRQVRVHSGFCAHCRKRVKNSHPAQVSKAVGAAGVQIGQQALSLAADLKHRLGLPYGKIADLFQSHFGLRLSPGGLVRAGQRLKHKLEPTHSELTEQLRASGHCHVDETGWKIGGKGAWLWVFTNQAQTAYIISQGRGQDVVRRVLGDNYAGILVSDCYSAYDSLPWKKAKCLGHIIHEMSELLAEKKGAARVFLRDALAVFRRAIQLKPRKSVLKPSSYAAQATLVEKALNGLLLRQLTDEDNLRLQKRFRKQREHLLRFLYHDQVEPTNNLAERRIRPAVIARKLSGCNRTRAGATTHEVLASLAVTCQQQGIAFVDLVRSALLPGTPTLKLFEPRASPA